MNLLPGYSRVKLSDIDAVLNTKNEIVGFVGENNLLAKFVGYESDPLTGGSTFSGATSSLKLPAGETDLSNVGASESVVSGVTVYNADGTTVKRCMPKNTRIIQKGAQWFKPPGLSGDSNRTVVVDTSGAFIVAEVDATPGVLMTCLTAGYRTASYTGLNLVMPSDGLLQALMWVPDYENAEAWCNSIVIVLTGASGTATYTFAGTTLRPGWNTLQLWNPATAAHPVLDKTGVSTCSVSGYNFTDNITAISFSLSTAVIGAITRIAGIWTQTKVKPMLAVTFDTSDQRVFNNFLPVWDAAGFKCTLRSGGGDSYRSSTWNTPLRAAYANGHDVNNGSWSRVSLTQSTTVAQMAREVGLHANYMQGQGFKRGATMFSTAGNAMPKATVYRDVLPKFGLKSAKGGTGLNRCNVFGPAGLDDRYYISAQRYGYPDSGSASGINAAKQQIDGIIYLGALLLWYAHDCPTGRVSVGGYSTGNGGSIYAEDVPELTAYLAPLVAAGSIDVVTASQLDNILDGLA